jgi:hypothetical protein
LGPSKRKDEDEFDEDKIDEGYDYMLKKGPRHNEGLVQSIWITKSVHKNSGTPISGWREGMVKEALRNLAGEGSFAKTYTSFWMTMADFEMHLVDLAARLLKNRKMKGNWILGKAGVGKSPFIKALMMCMSRQGKVDRMGDVDDAMNGQYRLTSEMDFFRGRPGEVDTPDIFDDGDSSSQGPKVLKAFGDISSEEAVAIARWTGCRWAKGQPRALLDNKVDLTAEVVRPGPKQQHETIPHIKFMELIHPAFHKDMVVADKEAVLKRNNFIVQTEDWLYIRWASADKVEVHRFLLPEKHTWIRTTSEPRYSHVLANKPEEPQGYQAALLWERTWANHVLRNGPHPGPQPIDPWHTDTSIPVDVGSVDDMFQQENPLRTYVKNSRDPQSHDGRRMRRQGAASSSGAEVAQPAQEPSVNIPRRLDAARDSLIGLKRARTSSSMEEACPPASQDPFPNGFLCDHPELEEEEKHIPARSVGEELDQLWVLHEKGVLDRAEFNDLKASVLVDYKARVKRDAGEAGGESSSSSAVKTESVVKRECGFAPEVVKAVFPGTVDLLSDDE